MILTLTPDRVVLAVRGLLGALTTDDQQPTRLQIAVIEAVARGVYGVEVDCSTLEPLAASDLAELAPTPGEAHQLVQDAIALELLVHPLPRSVERNVERFAATLGVDHHLFDATRDMAHGHLALMQADIERNSWYTAQTVKGILHGHLWELARSKSAYLGAPEDRGIARRWESLRDHAPGTLGRSVADFYEAHHFPFPGERHGIYELGAHHDFVHVLADYTTTPEGEIDVFAFIAATMADPRGFTLFAFTLGLFQNATITRVSGKKVAIARADTLDDPGAVDRYADALRRATSCTVDVMGGIDHFALADRPLDELRTEFHIVPKGVPGPGHLD
ncbi:MAG: hypothetical protein ACXWCM_08020 [Acidimicrobiales bacterium]